MIREGNGEMREERTTIILVRKLKQISPTRIRNKQLTWNVEHLITPFFPSRSVMPTSNDHSLPRLRTWRWIQGSVIPSSPAAEERVCKGGHRMKVVRNVGDWICRTVWHRVFPSLFSSPLLSASFLMSSLSSSVLIIAGASINTPPARLGKLVESFSK